MNDSFTPITGETRLTVGMAFDFNPLNNSSTTVTVAFDDLSQRTSPLSFGLDFSAGGGLYYTYERTGSGGPEIVSEVILAKSEIKMNALYTFTLDIDIANRAFKVSVSGTKANDEAFHYTESNLRSGNFNGQIGLVYLQNMANQNYTAYVDQIAFQPIPEPSTAALLFGAGAASAAFGLFRTTRNR